MPDDRRGNEDRRTAAWITPQMVLTILIQVVTTIAVISAGVANVKSDISSTKERIAELRGQVTTLQSLVQVTTEQKAKIESMDKRLEKVENGLETQTKAYNFNFTTRLSRVEAKTGIPPAKEGD